jgi:hypothetical protein
MTTEIDKLHTRIRELEEEIASVRAEAVEAVEFWGEFASNYSKAHHGLASDIESLRGKETGASPSETGIRGPVSRSWK